MIITSLQFTLRICCPRALLKEATSFPQRNVHTTYYHDFRAHKKSQTSKIGKELNPGRIYLIFSF